MNLTNEQIDKMGAGREMDAIIAEKVMGFEMSNLSLPAYPKIHLADGITGEIDPYYSKDCPYYSTDIADAWGVVEKLGKSGFDVNIEWKGETRVYSGTSEVAVIKGIYCVGHGVGTAPLAICRAALKAVINA